MAQKGRMPTRGSCSFYHGQGKRKKKAPEKKTDKRKGVLKSGEGGEKNGVKRENSDRKKSLFARPGRGRRTIFTKKVQLGK